jgi:hypothetical protein
MSATNHAAVVVANPAANKVEAIAGTEVLGSVSSREFHVVKPATRL